MNLQGLAILFSVIAAGCSGGGGSDASSPAPAPAPSGPASPSPAPGTPATSAPAGLYVGHYQEDRANNSEDPMPGSFYLNLPDGNAAFNGEMSFTYVGCQSSNVGTVSGTKNNLALSGNWTGTVDGVGVGGPYQGTYDVATQRYSGIYNNAGGKVHVTVQNCIDYHVAAYGTWEMSPIQARSPNDFTVSVSGGNVVWADVSGTSQWLASVYDLLLAQTGSQAVVRQALIPAINGSTADQAVALSSLGLVSGRAYVLAITAFGAENQRLGYTSSSYTAP